MNYNFKEWNFKELYVWMDGGSITLKYTDKNNQIHNIEVIQNMSNNYCKELSKIPGRIYVNNVLVGKRSSFEAKVLEKLKISEKNLFVELDKHIIKEKIEWIESRKYLEMNPTISELSENRKQILIEEGQIFQNELTIKNVEHQFNELRKEEISIKEFESWVYLNESSIKEQYSNTIYEELIILDYNDRHVKSDLAKVLELDYYKLELFDLRRTIKSILDSGAVLLSEISHDLYESVYDPHSRVWFGFKINEIGMGMNYPFDYSKEFPKLSQSERNRLFKQKFAKPDMFLKVLLNKIELKKSRLVIMENLKDIDNNDYTEAIYGTKSDILININKQNVIMNKEQLNQEMKKYWL